MFEYFTLKPFKPEASNPSNAKPQPFEHFKPFKP